MALVNGSDLRVYIGAAGSQKLLAYESSCDIELTQTMIATSSKDSGAWETSIPGRHSWGISASLLLDFADSSTKYHYDLMLQAFLNQTELDISFKTTTAGDTTLGGKAFIESMPIKSGDQSIVTIDVKFKGTGVLASGVQA